jgi:hypothetical protein
MLAEQKLQQQVSENHACTTPAETATDTTHREYLLIQHVFCKHGCPTPAVSTGVVKVNAGATITLNRIPSHLWLVLGLAFGQMIQGLVGRTIRLQSLTWSMS